MQMSSSRPVLLTAAGALAAAGIAGYAWYESRRPPVLEIYAFDTPGTVSFLIRTPGDRRVVVNGGANSDIVRHISSVLPFYSRRIDAVVAAKADAAHSGGLIDIVERYDVAEAFVPGVSLRDMGIETGRDQAYESFLRAIEGKSIAAKEAMVGQTIDIEESVSIEALFPTDAESFQYSKASAPEIVLKIAYGRRSVALVGGASIKIQKSIAPAAGPADVLVLSMGATSANVAAELVKAVRPRYIVHSQRIAAKAAKSASAKPQSDPLAGIMKEDRFNVRSDGTARIWTDGDSLSVSSI